MRTTKKIRCASCKKRIGFHEPDLVLSDVASGKTRYFHIRCDEAIADLILHRPSAYHLMIRHVEAERN